MHYSLVISRVPEIPFVLIGEGHIAPIPVVSARLRLSSPASVWRLPEDTQ